jgi:hypothetical protein
MMATAATASEPPGAILVLTGGNARANSGAREAVLVDALRIYTRDLGRAVRLGAAAPTELTAEALDRVAADARVEGADVVVWFGERAGVPLLYALKVASLELRETAVARDDTLGSARVTALKVRALVAPVVDDTQWAVPPEAPPPRAETPPPATTAPTTTAPPTTPPATTTPPPVTPTAPPKVVTPPPKVVTPPPTAKAAVVPVPPPRRERRTWLELTTAYQLIVPTNIDWLRQGLVVRLTVPWGRLPLAAFVDGAFTSAPDVAVAGATIGARIWPVGAGIVARLVRRRWQLAVGPRASLQIIEADARAGARTGSAQRLSAGVGVHAEGAWLFSRYVGAVVALGGEALLPRQQLSVGSAPDTTDLGWAQFTVTAGLLLRVP